MQLVAYGAQDVYLTGNPQITFFKVVYRRHTNFAVEPMEQTFQGAADFGRTVTAQINRSADLITHMYVQIDLAATTTGQSYGYVKRLGHAIIDEVSVHIGGTEIEKQYGDWLNIWYELTNKVGQRPGYSKMIGDVPELTNQTTLKPEYRMYIPLQFWFCRHNGLALPLIALQYHDTRICIKFRSAEECINFRPTTTRLDAAQSGRRADIRMGDALLLIDYVYLDAEERKKFAQAAHEYLIDVIQFTGEEAADTTNLKYRLTYNHPSKELIWCLKLNRYFGGENWVSWAADGNWEAARVRFAQLVYLATRTTLAWNAGNNRWEITIPNDTTDDITAPPRRPDIDLGAALLAVANKVNGQLIFADPAGTVAPAAVVNVALTQNDITYEDMSQTLAQLTTGVAAGVAVIGQFFTDNGSTSRDWNNCGLYIDGSENPILVGRLQLNSLDRFQKRDGFYFNYVQTYQHHENTPADGVNVYSFALKPEDHQPSGTANFSRIDNTTLWLEVGQRGVTRNNNFAASWLGTGSVTRIYATNYNVLRIMSGMGGLAYSN